MDHTERFSGKAALYDRCRPGYPAACIQDLLDTCGLQPGDRAADIGAGSGIFTEALLANGLEVCAVEPNADMASALRRRLKHKEGWQLFQAPAEATGLQEHSVDVVTAAQAFHWFDAPRFREECQRILKPGGSVALVWNSRDESSPLVQAMREIFAGYCPEFAGFSGGGRSGNAAVEAFFCGNVRKREFLSPLVVDREGFVGRALSSSYAPKQESERYEPFVKALAALFEQYSTGGKAVLPNVTRSYIGKLS